MKHGPRREGPQSARSSVSLTVAVEDNRGRRSGVWRVTTDYDQSEACVAFLVAGRLDRTAFEFTIGPSGCMVAEGDNLGRWPRRPEILAGWTLALEVVI